MEKFYMVCADNDLRFLVFFKDYERAWDLCMYGNTELYFDEHYDEEEVSDEVIAELTRDKSNHYYHIYEQKFSDDEDDD